MTIAHIHKPLLDVFAGCIELCNAPAMSNVERLAVQALVTIQVYERDVMEGFFKKGVRTVDDFEWLRQLRFYWVGTSKLSSTAVVRINDHEFQYGYEYYGCVSEPNKSSTSIPTRKQTKSKRN